MHAPFARLALSKAASDEERDALQPLVTAAEALDAAEHAFAAQLAASKARRGVMIAAQSRQSARYADDAAAMDAENLVALSAFTDARSIVQALHVGIESDATFWSNAATKAHPDDAALVSAFAAAKANLRDVMATYLREQPG